MENKVNNQNNGSLHIQLGGMAFYDESKYFLFSPGEHGSGKVLGFRMQGIAQQMTDGTFSFVPKPRIRSQSQLIKKMAHGRVSMTKDGAVQLTLKVFGYENLNISKTLLEEAELAADAVVNYQLRR